MQNPPPSQQQQGYGSPYDTPPPNAPLSTPPGQGPQGKSSIGLEPNVAAALSYIGIIGLIFFLIEKESRFVRFHALQSILYAAMTTVLFIVIMILSMIVAFVLSLISNSLAMLGVLLYFLSLLLWPLYFIGLILGAVKAYQGQMFKLPIVGNMAEKVVNK
jgi:uncharacterized membrane protein